MSETNVISADAKKHAKWIKEEMINALELEVPLKVDIAIGPTWLGA